MLSKVDFKWFPIIGMLIYIPFHLAEEAIGNFPLWMSEHYGLPRTLSYPHWLTNNAIFFLILFIGLIFFLKKKDKYLFLGTGIMVWLFMNSMEHIFFSIKDMRLSPGFFTAVLFFIISTFSFVQLKMNGNLNIRMFFAGVAAGIIYWVVPITAIVLLGNTLIQIFG